MMNQRSVNVCGTAVLFISTLFVTLGFLPVSNSANDALQSPPNVSCACPGEVLTFVCNITGGGTTLWTGTAFSCNSNEILLRHTRFSLPGGTSGSCNNGALTGRSIGVTDECYSSELNVTVSPDLNGRTILCNHDDNSRPVGNSIRMIGASTLNVMNAMDPPNSVELTGIHNGQAQFRWTPIDSCTSVHYFISTNCSSQCSPMTTNQTTTSCTVSEPTTDVVICDFSVQSVVCGNLMGDFGTAVITLQAQASSVNLIPHYSADNKSLSRFIIQGRNLRIALSDDSPIFIREYRVSYTDPTTGSVLHSTTVSSCGSDACDTDITLPSVSVCPRSASTVDVTVMVDTGFGQRPLSDNITADCTNKFVEVQYDSATSTITCTFLNQSDTSLKSCSIRYGSCDQKQRKTVQGNSSSSRITLSLESQNSFCYTAIARNDTFAVAVQGSIIIVGGAVSAGVIAAIVVVTVVVLLILLTISILIICLVCFSRRRRTTGGMIFSQLPIKVRLNLLENSQYRFKLHTIESSCRLRDAAPVKDAGDFKRGYAYYEFIHEKENISEGKEIIFMCEDRGVGHFFTPGPDVTPDTLRDYRPLGDGVKRLNLDNYVVFVQSTGSGARHLPAGSRLLYDQQEKEEWQPSNMLHVKVNSNHFQKSEIEKECTLKSFLEYLHLETKKCNVFLNICNVDRKKIGDIRDVILMKDNGDLLTGPGVRSLVDDPSVMQNIFVTAKFKNKTKLKEGVIVLHQDPEYVEERFHVLRVDENNVRMSAFIERKLKLKFENGRAFHEFTETEEDLLCYRDVVRMKKNISEKYKRQGDNGEEVISLETGIMYFYWMPRTPGAGIKPPMFETFEVFVQSTSQGSRCLKENTLVLYKV